MLEKSDQRFVNALESEEELEKLLKKLRMGRRWFVVSTVFSLIAAIVLFIMMRNTVADLPSGVGASLLLLPIMLLFVPVLNAMKALSLQGEIRTLMVFKKLRDDKSVVPP